MYMIVRTGVIRVIPQSLSHQCAIADIRGYLWNVETLLEDFKDQLVKISIEALEDAMNSDEVDDRGDYGHDRRTKLICTRVLAPTKMQIEKASSGCGLTTSEYTRQALLEKLHREQS